MLYTSIHDIDDIRVVQVLADIIQFDNHHEVFDRVRAQISDACNMIVLDLSRVKFMDSISLGMIVPLVLYTRRLGGDLKVAGLTPTIRSLFKVLRLDRVMDVYDDPAAAAASFHVE